MKTSTNPGSKEVGEEEDGDELVEDPDVKKHMRESGGLAQYMAGDRYDIKYSVKEVLREGDTPTNRTRRRLKRLARYLHKHRRFIWNSPWQNKPSKLVIKLDANAAGCPRTRKSTTSLVCLLGLHPVQDLSATQPLVSNSSGDSELYSLVRGCVEGVYIKHVLEEFGHEVDIELHSDASAGIGIMNRCKHIHTQYLYVQSLVHRGIVKMKKIRGEDNVSDIATKYVTGPVLRKLLMRLGVTILSFNGANVINGADAAKTEPRTNSEDAKQALVNVVVERMFDSILSSRVSLIRMATSSDLTEVMECLRYVGDQMN